MLAHEHISFAPHEVAAYYRARVPNLSTIDATWWRTACPLHGGERPSLAIRSDNGMWRCHSTCDAGGDIFDFEMRLTGAKFPEAKKVVLELTGKSDIPPRPKPVEPTATPAKSRPPKVIATYDYTDESGAPLFQVVRYEPKDFRQRHRASDNSWKYDLSGVRRVLFRLPRVTAATFVFVVEGEKDVLALEEILPPNCAATCNPMGAGKWDDAYSESLRGKRVVIIPDQDPPAPNRKPSQQYPGQRHALRVAESLKGIAAAVAFLHIPAPHKDFADWYNAEPVTIEQLRGLVTDKPPVIPGESAGESVFELPPPDVVPIKKEKLFVNDLAALIMTRHRWVVNKAGFLWKYNGRQWIPDTDDHIKALAREFDGDAWTSNARRAEVASFIRAACHQSEIEWRRLEQYEVPVLNGIVDIRTGELRPHRPEDMIESTAAVEYDPEADCPRWKQALNQYFGEDAYGRQKILAIAQFFLYALMSHKRYKKALILYGESDTGKSVVGEILCELVGRQNVCNIPVDQMGDPRKIAPIVGKSLNLIAELSAKAVIEDGGFKQLVSTGDPIQIDPKFGQPFSYVPNAAHLIMTNMLPSVNDRSRGTFNRLLIVRFNRVIPKEQQDKTIWDQLRAELPGILAWAIEGGKTLYENGGEFVEIPESTATIEEYRLDQNPILDFILEKCVPDEEGLILLSEFRSKYAAWLGVGARVPSAQHISAQLRSANYARRRTTKGNEIMGLRWKD